MKTYEGEWERNFKKVDRKNVELKLKYEQFLLRKGLLKDRLGDTNERKNRKYSFDLLRKELKIWYRRYRKL